MGQGRADASYLFIDGACLRVTLGKIADRYFGGNELKINYRLLRGNHDKVFYYDAIPAAKDGEVESDYQARIEPRKRLHERIAAHDRFHVYEGDSRVRRREVRQKKVDIMIAVDMLTHTVRGNMDRCTLIASDLDFKPLVDALVQEGMFVTLMYPPLDTARELYSSADERVPLSIRSVHPWLAASQGTLFEPPRWSLLNESDCNPADLIADIDDPRLGPVKLSKSGPTYMVHWNDLEWPDAILRVSGENYQILRNALKEHHRLDIPETAPA